MTNPNKDDLNTKIDDKRRKQKNPYKDALLWFKGELLDIQRMNEALQGREQLIRQQNQMKEKKKSDEQQIKKLDDGKKTLKSLFKSKTQIETFKKNLKEGQETID